ncbi:hypothetical protein PVK06_040105 [Gossypium arboreum]|uniref:DUF4219 domain-containing protein n=1 Tax=Gossypium arboreum TaxID=29729 RepID=A0ABR0N4L1_GOSAR|nr:hypothetical protein PVK06_040105 [Gossypium arboreum]
MSVWLGIDVGTKGGLKANLGVSSVAEIGRMDVKKPKCQEAARAMHAAVKKGDQTVVLLPGETKKQGKLPKPCILQLEHMLLLNHKMMASSGFSPTAPPVFNGEGYHIWMVKMRTYLQAFNLWEVVNSDIEPAPLRANPTVAQIRQHADERTKRHKTMSCIQNSVSDVIFTRIMACETQTQA